MQRMVTYKPFGILRFTLAMFVLVQHFATDIAPPAIKAAIFPFAVGNVAVLAFFILSGFIICEAYHDNYQGRPSAYILNRLVRIVPGYWAALIISIVAHYFLLQHYGHLTSLDQHDIGFKHFGLPNILKNIVAIFPPFRVNVNVKEYPFIPYAWALQTEMMFYLTVFITGVAYLLLRRVRDWPMGIWLALAGYSGIAVAIGAKLGWLPEQLSYGSYFAFGGALYFVLEGYRKATWVMVPAFLQMMWHFSDYGAANFTVIPANRLGQYALLLAVTALIGLLATEKFERVKVDKIFGEYSYPLYLNHYVIAVVILNTANHFTAEYLFYGVIASLLLSVTMFKLIDRPLMHIRRIIRQRNTV